MTGAIRANGWNEPSPVGVEASMRSRRAIFWILSISAYLVVFLVMFVSLRLRPMADDYYLAVSAKDGLLAGLLGQWNGWSGDLTTTFSNVLLVGLPLLSLPWELASAIPFTAAVTSAVGLAAWLLVFRQQESRSRRERGFQILLILPLLAIGWWGYWWVPVLFSKDAHDMYSLAQGVTFWQNLNSAYVVTTLLLTWAWIYLEGRATTAWLGALYFLLGLLAGFSGPVFAGGALVMIVLIAIYAWLGTNSDLPKRGLLWLVACIGLTFGAVASYFSPGSQLRMTVLADPKLDSNLLLRILSEGVPRGVQDWWVALTSPGSWVLVLLLIGSTALLVNFGWTPKPIALARIGIALVMFSLVLSIVNRLSEFFAYEAYWHMVTPRTAAWIGIVLLAASLGGACGRLPRQALVVPLLTLSCAIGLMLVIGGVALMVSEVYAREIRWERGPAPLAHVTDIEDPDGFQRRAYLELLDIRGGPLRGL